MASMRLMRAFAPGHGRARLGPDRQRHLVRRQAAVADQRRLLGHQGGAALALARVRRHLRRTRRARQLGRARARSARRCGWPRAASATRPPPRRAQSREEALDAQAAAGPARPLRASRRRSPTWSRSCAPSARRRHRRGLVGRRRDVRVDPLAAASASTAVVTKPPRAPSGTSAATPSALPSWAAAFRTPAAMPWAESGSALVPDVVDATDAQPRPAAHQHERDGECGGREREQGERARRPPSRGRRPSRRGGRGRRVGDHREVERHAPEARFERRPVAAPPAGRGPRGTSPAWWWRPSPAPRRSRHEPRPAQRPRRQDRGLGAALDARERGKASTPPRRARPRRRGSGRARAARLRP